MTMALDQTPLFSDLFSVSKEKNLPTGFVYQPNFITNIEEEKLLENIKRIQFHDVFFKGYKAQRRVKTFGWIFDKEQMKMKKTDPISKFLLPLQAKVGEWTDIKPDLFSEALITEYTTGSAMGWHRDSAPFETVVGISLLSSCRMRLKPMEDTVGELTSIELEPCSAYIIGGSSRTNWQHSIPPTKDTRYSITFRTLRDISLYTQH